MSLTDFARMIALSKLSSTNPASFSTNESYNNPIITQVLNKLQGSTSSTSSEEFQNNQKGKFSMDAWIISETDFSYTKHIVQNKILEATDGNNPGWKPFMVGAKVGQLKLLLVRNNGRFIETMKQGDEIPLFLALEIKLLGMLPFEPIKKNSHTRQENTKHELNGKMILYKL